MSAQEKFQSTCFVIKQKVKLMRDQRKEARRQAKKILKALQEAELIRRGKLRATTVEEHFDVKTNQ